MNIKDKIMDTLLQLVAVPGIAGKKEESVTAEKIINILEDIPYFSQYPENLNLIKISEDPLNRSFVSALFCSSKPSKKHNYSYRTFRCSGCRGFWAFKGISF